MRQSTLFYAICTHLFATAALAEKEAECLKGPLVLEGRPPCAPTFKLKKKPTFQDEKFEWKGKKSDAWDGPYDCVEDYCVYVNSDLNDGMVLVSAETNVHVVDGFPKHKMFQHDIKPFYVAEMPKKGGIGLVANRTIKKGEIIMQTTPAMLIQFGPHLDFDGESRLKLYERASKRLPKKQYDSFMRQYGADEYMKVDRNAFRLFINGENPFSGHLAIYPDVAQMNHDCRPNVHYRMDNITHISVAVQDILAGEELTVSYIDAHQSRKERQNLLDDWGFKCQCAHCTMSDVDVEISDARMKRIYAIEEELEKMVAGEIPIDTALADELVRGYEEEKFFTYIGQAYTRAALLHSLMGNEKETRVLAKKAAEAMELEYGVHSKDTQAMKLLSEDFTAHWSWDAMRKSEERKKQMQEAQEKEAEKEREAEKEKEKPKIAWKVQDITAEDLKDLKP